MARRGQRPTGARRPDPRNQRRGRDRSDVVEVLARAVREVEAAVARGSVTPSVRAKFQAVALVLREERARVLADQSMNDGRRAERLKRLEGIATILATTAVRDAALFRLLAEDAVISDEVRARKREMLQAAGIEAAPDEAPPAAPTAPSAVSELSLIHI